MTLARKVMPTMCGAALRGVGVEPFLDSVAEYLPCPMDRLPPQLRLLCNNHSAHQSQHKQLNNSEIDEDGIISLGHPLHTSTLVMVVWPLHECILVPLDPEIACVSFRLSISAV